ncbi:putative short-chain dehydrogenase/reductase family protein [Aspergillus clavatus NRRL 1]|uniref:Short-chain dehydrogenase/reductase family protein n=1 Tax=Aspergillus clavatus (strain ATCC 1007 / CBS 513.65 / DSM 816 / NCTC 3887 / NRRL 1 / QM 1276 / 107) TaxID=344612 RepID=A1CSE1_ASPCL|nr:uncharacterized protein ACLA_032980 [Aspergillus clavatus NRRL 1]EAW08562.1 conserved hypothetical protein [Aspergillus clavatus NRRL 1]
MGFLYSQLCITPAYPTASFTGQTIIVTGSNVGLGLEAARHFVRLDAAKVILAVRNRTAGEAAKKSIEESTQRQGVVEVWDLDLASYASVLAFAEKAKQLARLDVLLCNASIATENFRLVEGHESSITVNVLGTLLLEILMLPVLRRSARAYGTRPRLTTVVSEVHAWSKFPEWKAENTFTALDDEKHTSMGERYATTKLLQVLALREMVARMEKDEAVIMNMVNPGLCHSQLGREAGIGLALLKMALARTTEVGSRTLVAGAAAGENSHGAYMTDGLVDNNALSPFVRSEDGKQAQEKVWRELGGILEEIQPGVMSNL